MSDIVLEVRAAGFQPDPGAYVVKVTRVERIPTRLGEAIRVWVTHPKWGGEWGFVVSPRLSSRSTLGKLCVAAGLELKPGEKVNLATLVGKEVGVMIIRNAQGFARPSGFFGKDQAPF